MAAGQSGKGRLLKITCLRPCLWANHWYREKLALNNPDRTSAFRPGMFSTFDPHLAAPVGQHRHTKYSSSHLYLPCCAGTSPAALPAPGSLCSGFRGGPASLPGFSSGFGHNS